MSRTLLQLRADTRLLVDDINTSADARWSDAQVDLSILRAATGIGQLLAQAGQSDVVTRTTITLDGAGNGTIPANDGVLSVFVNLSTGVTCRILPGNGSNRSLTGVPQSGSLIVEYLAKTVAPAGDGYTVTYAGVDVQDLLVDQLCAYMAADDLKSVEAEPNLQVARKLPQLEGQVRAKYSPGITVAPATKGFGISRYSTTNDSRWFRSGPTTITIYR